jgi:predicted O-methyltransferase YrrM
VNHFYQRIPGWFDFQDVYAEAVARAKDGARFAELGTFMGKSLAFLAVEIVNSGKAIAVDSVDTTDVIWIPPIEEPEQAEARRRWHGEKLSDVIAATLAAPRARGLVHRHHTIDSIAAARQFGDQSFDFVFLDTIHLYEQTKRELEAWWPKVKTGGVFAGHDHTAEFPGVEKACREFFGPHYQIRRSSFVALKS